MVDATSSAAPGVEPEVKIYICRFLQRLLASPRQSARAAEDEAAPIFEGGAPCASPQPEIVGASAADDDNEDVLIVFARSDHDEDNGDEKTPSADATDVLEQATFENADAKVTKHSKQLEEVVNSKVAFLEERSRSTYSSLDSTVTKYSQQLGGAVHKKATIVADKAKATYTAVDTSAMKYSQQLEGVVNQKTATIADKAKATYTVVDASAMKYSQQLEGVVSERAAAIADKTKAAAALARTKSGELASKSGQLASTTRGKFQAAGQEGLRALASLRSFSFRGGA